MSFDAHLDNCVHCRQAMDDPDEELCPVGDSLLLTSLEASHGLSVD